MKVFLVEDEKNLNELLKGYLEKEGMEVTNFFSGEDAIKNLNINYDIYVLDIMLNGSLNGYDLIKEIKKNNSTASVIFISARDSDVDRVLGLEHGSEDYITKPFSPKELVIRINNIMKRNLYSLDFMKYESYKIDIRKRLVYLNDKLIKLTTKEFDLLLLFLENKEKAFSREDILYKIWEEDYFGSDRVVDDLIRRLRAKMDKLNLETIYGFGYRLT
ncbi:MAG: response regulator transcription factor [Bacilli bacterium]